MSAKPGTSGQVISLPTGGGAVQGIGETFAPDPFTGTGNLTVPLSLPPGRNGFQPQLSLVYSSGTGNGPFGLGWALSLPGVSRKTSTGVPRYRDASADRSEQDTFVLSGMDDLVPVAGPEPGVTRYRPRTEGVFARIDRVRTPAEDLWRVHAKDGNVSRYGGGPAGGGEPAVVADPADRRNVFRWDLAQTTDPFGNRIDYRHLRDTGSAGPNRWDQLYLQQVRYVDVDGGGSAGFLVTVTFFYTERPDPFSDHRAGFEVRTRLRCNRIEVRTHAGQDRLTRTYQLSYVDERVRAGELPASAQPANRMSLLSQIIVVGHDGDRTERLPPLEFGYTGFAPQRRRFQAFEAAADALPPRSLADDDFEMVDLFASGLPDIVQMNGVVQFWRNLGGGRFDVPRTMAEVPAGVHLRDPGVQFVDLNGDGRADLLAVNQGGYFPLGFQGRWSERGFVRYPQAPAVSFGDAETRLVDLDGDGVVDALRTGERFELFLNDPRRGWEVVETRPRRPAEEFPDVRFSDPRVKLADLNGDGLQDVVLVRQGRVDYWPYAGHGRWGRRVTMRNSPVFRDAVPLPGEGFDPRRVLVGDLDGDGLDDVAYLQPGRLTVWLNQGGDGWSEPVTIEGTPPFSDPDAVRLADMLGSGMAGVLWTFDRLAGTGSNYRFLDLCGGVKPYLLEQVDNHIGAVTRIRYAPSTEFYRTDLAAPQTRWATPLPFPVQVVDRVEVTDEISQTALTSRYRYHHGYWDGVEREFRGFGLVEQLDTDTDTVTDAAPPTLTRTWFHLGPVGDEFDGRTEADLSGGFWPGDPPLLDPPPELVALLAALPPSGRADAFRSLRGKVLRTELYAVDGTERADRPMTVTETRYGIREESPAASGADRVRVFFPHPVAERTTVWERGDDPMTSFAFSGDYDGFGQPRVQTEVACPRGWRRLTDRPGQPYLATRLRRVMAAPVDPAGYLHDRVARTTVQEIRGTAGRRVRELATRADDDLDLEPVSHTVRYYDGPAFTGMPFGQLGGFGALVREETLVLTDDLLRGALSDEDGAPAEIPPYLRPGGPVPWTDDYPVEFRSRLPVLAGYTHERGDAAHLPGYYARTRCVRYDFQDRPDGRGRGLPVAWRDPLGTDVGERDSTVRYDDVGLLPVEVRAPAGLVTRAENDYRVLRARLVTDANGNRSAFAFTPLGLLERSAVLGKEGENAGDTLEAPGTLLRYDLRGAPAGAAGARRPISVRTIRRVHHITDTTVTPAERDRTIETVEFSDGFGRLVQTRTRAEDAVFGDPVFGGGLVPAEQSGGAGGPDLAGRAGDPVRPNVVVSGARRYDGKGRLTQLFEPFLAAGWEYAAPAGGQLRHAVTTGYDAVGRAVRVTHPDGSQRRMVPGVPADLADPDRFTPTPWESFSYDANDNAGRTHPDETDEYSHHWDTPVSTVLDALGRTVSTVERLRAPPVGSGPPAPAQELRTAFRYDIRDNLLTVIDPLGRTAFTYRYDLANRPLRTESVDAGVRRTVPDAAGNEVERRDSRGALVLQAHDVLGRPARLWARDDAAGPVTLRERLEYGDGGDPTQPAAERAAARAANRLGALHEHYDEAGRCRFTRYDIKGNVLDRARQVIADDVLVTAFAGPGDPDGASRVAAFRVDWQPPPGLPFPAHVRALLDPTEHLISARYDALDRTTAMLCPQGVDGNRRELRASYDPAGLLDQVRLDGDVIVERIARDAKGQRTLVALNNGVLTRYARDPRTSRLVRLRTEHYTKPNPTTYRTAGQPVQDLQYRYDLTGNILEIVERTRGCGVRANPEAASIADPELRALVAAGDGLVRRFGYDSLHRLSSATGRECAAGAPVAPWSDVARCGFGGPGRPIPTPDNGASLSAGYTERYSYDPAGNLVRLRHSAGGAAVTRTFALTGGGNQLRTLTAGGTEFGYSYDGNGNLVQETESRHFGWDHSDRMTGFAVQNGASSPSVQALYLYDAAGQRVRKLVRTQDGGVQSTTYLDGVFERHRWRLPGGARGENDEIHVLDGDERIAAVRTGPPHPDDRTPATRYQFGDHLGSVAVTMDAAGAFVEREEYTPYGETSFGSVARKRYRFGGQERDAESGLYCAGARYYSPGLARWISPDPAGLTGGANGYSYAASNPITVSDPTGLQPESETLIVTTAGGRTFGGSEATGYQRVDFESMLLGNEQAWRDGTIDAEVLQRGSDEVIEVAGQTETINGNVFSSLDGEYWILFSWEKEPRQVSKEAYQNARYWSDYIEGLSPEQLDAAFGGVEALGRFLDKAVMVGMFLTPAGRAAIAVTGVIDGSVSFAQAESGSDRAWAAAEIVASLPLPGFKARSPVSAAAPAADLDALAAARRTSNLVQEPDVYAISLVRRRKIAGTGRGVTPADRAWAREVAARHGHSGPVDVGHAPGSEHVFTRPGQEIMLRPEPRGPNRSAGARLRPEVERVRANPQLGIPVRPKRTR